MGAQLSQTNAGIQPSGQQGITVNATVAGIAMPATSQEVKQVYTNGVINGTIATVTTGKTAYIIGIVWQDSAASTFTLKDNAGTGLMDFRSAGADTVVFCPGFPTFKYTSGQAIKIQQAATATSNVLYIEV